MKNIHILPTDKPSRLYLNTQEYIFEEECSLSTDECQNKHIYITSDEEIKEGDYFIAYSVTSDKKPYISCASEYKERKKEKGKIILTNDKDLIKDGVQAIGDGFLEWFVKNPSCESVEVVNTWMYYPKKWEYEIIIPKEEPKQETTSEGFHRISKEFDYSEFDFVSFKIGTEWQQEQFSKSEFIQLVRATKSDAEARRIIREYFK